MDLRSVHFGEVQAGQADIHSNVQHHGLSRHLVGIQPFYENLMKNVEVDSPQGNSTNSIDFDLDVVAMKIESCSCALVQVDCMSNGAQEGNCHRIGIVQRDPKVWNDKPE